MSRFARVPRRPDHWSSAHERARTRAAERIDAALDPAEAAWLESHLAGCAACAAVAAAYDTDRFELRTLRDVPISAPRDLWARTSAGIEREASRRRRAPRRATSSGTGGRSRLPIGAMSGIAVVAIVVGATALSGGWLDQPSVAPAGTPVAAAASEDITAVARPPATPIAVLAGSVGWVNSLDDGQYAFNRAAVDHVCPVEDQPGCAALDDSGAKRIDLTSTPRSIIGSPTDDQAVVVGSDGSGADQIVLLSLPASAEATLEPTPAPTPTATTTAAPTEAATPTPVVTAAPTDAASGEPTPPASEDPSASAEPSAPAETATPEPTPTEAATPEPTPEATPTPTAIATPQATAKAIAIATGVTVVGQSAAFSPDGKRFAFTARPADGSSGPDIYVWHTGDDTARRLTTDGRSVFASWSDDRVVGSRIAAAGETGAQSFLADPRTGKVIGDPIELWRPVVDPTDRFAVAWSGAVGADDAGTQPILGDGGLVLTSWQADADNVATRAKVPGGDAEIADFDIRWDESGEWLAIWTADPSDPSMGRLSLFHLDRGSGALERPKGSPSDVPALPGFSIGDGRLAWVTPHGQDAEGSRVQVVAWSGDSVGAVESVPGEGVVVVR